MCGGLHHRSVLDAVAKSRIPAVCRESSLRFSPLLQTKISRNVAPVNESALCSRRAVTKSFPYKRDCNWKYPVSYSSSRLFNAVTILVLWAVFVISPLPDHFACNWSTRNKDKNLLQIYLPKILYAST